MEPSKTETTENSPERGGDQPRERVRWTGPLRAKQSVRALLGVEAASFLLASAIHAGVLIRGYEHPEAMIAEGIIGTLLLLGLVATWVRPRTMFSVAAGVQAFALLGTLVGLWTIVVGVGPRTVPDVVYHVAIVLVLAVGIRLAWRARGTEAVRTP